MTDAIAELNAQYGLADQLVIRAGVGDWPLIEINNGLATAHISLYAAHLLSFQPAGDTADVIFLSSAVQYQPGRAIRGGTPICWPWFGSDPEGLGRSSHGFVRNRLWNLVHTATRADGATIARLAVENTPETEAIWPYAFRLELEFTVGTELTIALTTHNRSDRSMTLTQALHTYFRVGDIHQTVVQGLAGKSYIDKLDGEQEKMQVGEITITEAVDRIYHRPHNPLFIVDSALDRRIRVESTGSQSAVVWNPWAAGAAQLGDLGNEDYRQFVCVETTNAAADQVTIAPGQAFTLQAVYQVER